MSSGVGKSSVLVRFVDDKFQANYVKVDASRRGVHSTPEIFELRAQMHF